MLEKRKSTFENCHCPYCKYSLHQEFTDISACPGCRRQLEARDVWMARKYPGMTVLPGWLKAFGWPFLLIIAGFAIIGISYETGIPVPLKLPALFIGTGMLFFIVKLATNGEDI
jgi:hypothetical protein